MKTTFSLFYHSLLAGLIALSVFVFAGPHLYAYLNGEFLHAASRESVSLSVYGRFGGRAFVTDAYAGEFPAFYNFLSDWIINFIGRWTHLPPAQVQSVIYVPLLVAGLILGSYISVRAVGGDRSVALLATIFIVGAAQPPFAHLLAGGSAAPQFVRLHTPVTALGVGSAQVLAWALFLPVLAALFVAVRSGSSWRAIMAGSFLGLLCLVHTLTFLNCATAAAAYLATLTVITNWKSGRRNEAYLRILAVIATLIIISVVSKRVGLSMTGFIALWAVLFLVSIKDLASLRFAMLYGLGAFILCLPYAFQIYEIGLHPGQFGQTDYLVPVRVFAVFFLLQFACAALVVRNLKSVGHVDVIVWASTILIVCISMGYDKHILLRNHQYRFLIHAIFPLSILAAFVVHLPWSASRKFATHFLIPLLLAGMVRNFLAVVHPLPPAISRVIGPFAHSNGALPPPHGTAELLARVKIDTEGRQGSRLLLPPEYSYPEQGYRNALILGVSQVASFIPDPRYIVWHDLYADRVQVFCSVFPDYPHADAHFGFQHCAKRRAGFVTEQLGIKRPDIIADVFSLYRLELMPLLGGHHDGLLARGAAAAGMRLVHSVGGGQLWRTQLERGDNRLTFGAATYLEPEFKVPVTAPVTGRFAIVLAGRPFRSRGMAIRMNGQSIAAVQLGEDAAGFMIDLVAGPSQLIIELEKEPRYSVVFPAPLRFITGVHAASARDVFHGPALEDLLRP
jgi:hypothetical protein